MPNPRLNTKHPKHCAVANPAGHQVVAHKSTGGIANSFPEPVDPVGNDGVCQVVEKHLASGHGGERL